MARQARLEVVSYVVRVYRHTAGGDAHDDTLAGLVENGHRGERHAFHNMAELWDILRHGDAAARIVPDDGAPVHPDGNPAGHSGGKPT